MKILRSSIVSSIILSLLYLLSGCNEKAVDNKNGIRDSLYQKVCKLTKSYTDSLSHATDTLEAQTILNHYESKMQSLYMRFPPATDRLLTEDYNDTIYLLTQKLQEAYKRAIAPFDSMNSDSVSADSLKWRIPMLLEATK